MVPVGNPIAIVESKGLGSPGRVSVKLFSCYPSMVGVSLDCGDGSLLRSGEEALEVGDVTSSSNFFESTEETHLHTKRIGHVEFTGRTSEVTKPTLLEVPKVAEKAEEAINTSTSQHEGNSGAEAAVKSVVEREDNPCTDQAPLVPMNSKVVAPSLAAEEMKARHPALREHAGKRKEEEEKKTERQKEKEGIRMGGELLEATGINEGSDQQKIMALQITDKEEEKRAREKDCQRLEQEKGIMGKNLKKKNQAFSKESSVPNHYSNHFSNQIPQPSNLGCQNVEDGGSLVEERKQCSHLEKGVDLNKVLPRIGSTESVRCEDCRAGGGHRKGGKRGSKKSQKKGGNSSDLKSDSKAIWICLQCGHHVCGGIGLPTSPKNHAVRHFRLTHHPLLIQYENPHLRWCFPCNTLIRFKKGEGNSEHKDIFVEVVKSIKGQEAEGSSHDVQNVGLRGHPNLNESKTDNVSLSLSDGSDDYFVRGLVNLGNTCFFNSILQNLLAMDPLRDYFLNLEASTGPLTMALKKLCKEVRTEGRTKSTVNPRSLFGSISSKAPQFKGYQQHDSHELLRFLLDGLHSEELGAKQAKSSNEDTISSNPCSTFVDEIFGGKVSSTVCCAECGHSSTIYEPYLDLSLSVPTKKPLTKKKIPLVKKTKPPKKGGNKKPIVLKDADALTAQSILLPSVRDDRSLQPQSSATGSTSIVVNTTLISENVSTFQESKIEVVSDDTAEKTLDSFSWLDYLGPESIDDDQSFPFPNDDDPNIQENENMHQFFNDASLHSSFEPSAQSCSLAIERSQTPHFSSRNSWEDECPLQVQDSEILLLAYKEESSSTGEVRVEDQASSSNLGGSQDDFDGFVDLFYEPEFPIGPVARPSSSNEVTESGFMVGNTSESDSDEIDNSDSQVSVESCLAYFTKLELLSGENGYNCERCSEKLQKDKVEMLEKKTKASSTHFFTGHQIGKHGDFACSSKESCSNEIVNFGNIDIKGVSTSTTSESLIVHDDKVESLSQNCGKIINGPTNEIHFVPSRQEGTQSEVEDQIAQQSHSSSCRNTGNHESASDPEINSYSNESRSSRSTNQNFKMSGENRKSDKRKVEEMKSKIAVVKRNATKRFLIHKAPPILTIHIKRFSPDVRGRYTKLNGHVHFSEMIDLRPFMDSRFVDRERYDYRLIGVVEHLGTMRGGHYVAYVRVGKRKNGNGEGVRDNDGSMWYHVSDAYVREVSLNEVLRCEAYILFYEIT